MIDNEFEDLLMLYSDRHKELNGFRPDAEDYRFYRENPSELPVALEFLRRELDEVRQAHRLWIPEAEQD